MSKMTDEITAWLLTFQSVRDWETNIQSESTKALYFKYFTQYCRAVDKNPDELLALKVEGLQNIGKEKEFQEREEAEADAELSPSIITIQNHRKCCGLHPDFLLLTL